MLLVRLTIAAALLAACGSDPVPFSIQFELDTGDSHQCPSTQCNDFGMRCGAVLGVRIVEAEAALAKSDGGTAPSAVRAEHCIKVDSSDTLCGLDDVVLAFPEVKTGRVQIQVALWSPDDVTPPDCPTDIFNFQGIPDDSVPQPAFGGATFFDIGKETVATIDLACSNPALLDKQSCLPDSTLVTAGLVDMETVVPVRPEVAPLLNVSVGEPQLDTGADPPEWVIGPTDAAELDLEEPVSDPPVWLRDPRPDIVSHGCVLAALDVPQPITNVACTDDLTLESDGALSLTGLHLPQSVLNDLLGAAGIATFPPEGLVIGRVVSSLQAPAAGVALATDPEGAEILYVNNDRNGLVADETSPSGYFISRDAPFDTQWTASDGTGRTQRTDVVFRAGLIVGKLSLVVIEMTE